MITRDELLADLSAYAAGLDAELALLRRVQRLSLDQRESTDLRDPDRLAEITTERERLMAALVKIEHDIRDMRLRLANNKAEASLLPGFDDVARAHRSAGALIAEILASDSDSMVALRDAELARRQAAQAIDTGETTLAAYRRVIAPSLNSPALLTRRG